MPAAAAARERGGQATFRTPSQPAPPERVTGVVHGAGGARGELVNPRARHSPAAARSSNSAPSGAAASDEAAEGRRVGLTFNDALRFSPPPRSGSPAENRHASTLASTLTAPTPNTDLTPSARFGGESRSDHAIHPMRPTPEVVDRPAAAVSPHGQAQQLGHTRFVELPGVDGADLRGLWPPLPASDVLSSLSRRATSESTEPGSEEQGFA